MQNEEKKRKITRKDEKLKSAGALEREREPQLRKTRKVKEIRRYKSSFKTKASNSHICFNNSSNAYSSITRKQI